MTLAEFLTQPEIVGLSDEEALAALLAYEKVSLVKIDTDVRKTAIETVEIFNGTVERLNNFTPDAALTPEQQAIAADLAPKIVKAFNKLMSTQFYINLNDPDVAQAFTAANAYGVLTQIEYDGIYKAAESKTRPFVNSTLHDVKLFRDVGETIVLTSDNNHHKAKISITTQPTQPVNITVEQRFSKDGVDWSEWHNVGTFLNVYYRQRDYETSVPQSPASFRQLRAVSPLTLGVSEV